MRRNYRELGIKLLLPATVFAVSCPANLVAAQPAVFNSASSAVHRQMSSAREASGIKVERVTYAVGGMKLDLRYRVTDIKKARQIFNSQTPLALIDQATGKVLGVPNMPKIGKLRQVPNQDEAWRVYWIMFDNPGALVRRGGRVTLAIGDVRIRDIIVE